MYWYIRYLGFHFKHSELILKWTQKPNQDWNLPDLRFTTYLSTIISPGLIQIILAIRAGIEVLINSHNVILRSDSAILFGQRHAKRDLRTYAKSVDSDQPPRLRRRVWSESALFDTHHINSTYISVCVRNWITYSCFQYHVGTDLGLHYVKCRKVPFRVTLAIWSLIKNP